MRYDALVIGSGQGGVPLAARLAEAGRRTAIVERSHLGGTCVNTGCTPTKTMIASARAAHVTRTAGRLGVRAGDVRVDLATVVDRKNKMVDQWRSSVARRLDRAGANLTLIRGEARFTGPRKIEVNGEEQSAETVIINTGGHPVTPPIEGLDAVAFLDNKSAAELRELPSHLIVLGGGYIGCEFAQMYRRFGADVTVVQRAGHLLPREDEDVSEAVEQVFRDESIELRLGTEPRSIRRQDDGVVADLEGDGELRGSHLMVAVGRGPNTDALNCEAAGVELDDRGYVVADDVYQTTAEGIYAIGDVLGAFPQFTHSSWDDGRLLFDLLTGPGTRGRSDRIIPYCVFTDPQVARVGLSERDARAMGIEHEVASMPFGHVARAIETDETSGVMKVLLDPRSERVLGATIVGAEAGELIHIFVTLMSAGASARAIVEAEAVHPTFAEGVQSLIMRLDRYSL